MGPPLIGIPVARREGEYYSPQAYSAAVEAAGGIPLLFPLFSERFAHDGACRALQGLLLAGGGDVAAEFYGTRDGGALIYVDRVRDMVELELTHWALANGLSILGICRGIQVLNVAAGGTLIQDIGSEVAGALVHRAVGRDAPTRHMHDIAVQGDSSLARCLGAPREDEGPLAIAVNSTHHQAVGRLAEGWRTCAVAPDGVIEGIERADRGLPLCLGVQWHPERLVPGDQRMAGLFRSFVSACSVPA